MAEPQGSLLHFSPPDQAARCELAVLQVPSLQQTSPAASASDGGAHSSELPSAAAGSVKIELQPLQPMGPRTLESHQQLTVKRESGQLEVLAGLGSPTEQDHDSPTQWHPMSNDPAQEEADAATREPASADHDDQDRYLVDGLRRKGSTGSDEGAAPEDVPVITCGMAAASSDDDYNPPPSNRSNPGPVSRLGMSSSYLGVTWYKASKRWQARLCLHNKKYHLGYYATEEEAARAYDKAVIQMRGPDAPRNFPKEDPTSVRTSCNTTFHHMVQARNQGGRPGANGRYSSGNGTSGGSDRPRKRARSNHNRSRAGAAHGYDSDESPSGCTAQFTVYGSGHRHHQHPGGDRFPLHAPLDGDMKCDALSVLGGAALAMQEAERLTAGLHRQPVPSHGGVAPLHTAAPVASAYAGLGATHHPASVPGYSDTQAALLTAQLPAWAQSGGVTTATLAASLGLGGPPAASPALPHQHHLLLAGAGGLLQLPQAHHAPLVLYQLPAAAGAGAQPHWLMPHALSAGGAAPAVQAPPLAAQVPQQGGSAGGAMPVTSPLGYTVQPQALTVPGAQVQPPGVQVPGAVQGAVSAGGAAVTGGMQVVGTLMFDPATGRLLAVPQQ